MHLSHADHSTSPPRVDIPRDYNAAYDLLQRNAARSAKTAYIDAASGDHFEACGRVVRASRNGAFAEGELLDAQGRTCATAKGIWRIFWPREPAPAQP